MPTVKSNPALRKIRRFLRRGRPGIQENLFAVSLFSGAGLSDLGYELAGFRFCAQVESDETRAAIGQANFPHSTWIADDARTSHNRVVAAFREKCSKPPALLVATPPCQGMSSSNPSRGKRDTDEAKANEWKNRLLLELSSYANELRPRIIVAENVRQILTLKVNTGSAQESVLNLLQKELPDYELFASVINVSDYGIPQDRRRAVIVGVRKTETWLETLKERKRFPWPAPTHAKDGTNGLKPWVSVGDWLRWMKYERLDARSPERAIGTHPLHFVPHYDEERYALVRDIPPRSGRSAYENDRCPSCAHKGISPGRVRCPMCRQPLTNRPIVRDEGKLRLIKGFKSSYRRMHPKCPAPTVTTNSSHVGSDNKIHPWEHRVLSILECAELQTVPRCFDWTLSFEARQKYLIRNLIGEAFPTYFTFLHGSLLAQLLNGELRVIEKLARNG
jgi:DNA (cytosine-5)-methyltransferase 1